MDSSHGRAVLELVPPMTAQEGPLRQLIEDHREQAEEGHERLRRDYRALEARVERLNQEHNELARKVDRIEHTPPTIETMAWTTKQLIAIVVACIAIAGGMWQLHTDIDRAASAAIASAKLQDERNENLKAQITAALAESRLNGIKTDNLSKQLADYMVQRPRRE